MNEPPGARMRVALSGLTVAENFRDQGQDVLFFVDNIFRFTQADAGAHYIDQQRFHYIGTSRVRAGG